MLAVAVAPRLLLGLFGPDFEDGALALQILALGQAIRLATGPVGSIIVMTGHQRWTLYYALSGAALMVAFAWALIPPLGAVGAAWATVAATLCRQLTAAVVVQRLIGIRLIGGGRLAS